MPTQLTTNGFGFVVREVNTGLEGAFGLGFVLGTNLTLDVQSANNAPLLRNTPYALRYTDPATGTTRTVSIMHDPDVPYQGKLPENVVITFTLPASAFYEELTLTFTIAVNTVRVVPVRANVNAGGDTVTLRYHY